MSMSFGQNLTQLRKMRGWSQQDLAQNLGVSRQTVIAFEQGQRVPPLNLAIKLADLLGLSLDTLVSPLRNMPRAQHPEWILGTAPELSGPAAWGWVQGRPIIVPWQFLSAPEQPDLWWDAERQQLTPLPHARAPEHVLLIGGCDPFVAWIKSVYQRQFPGYWLEPIQLSSQSALQALKAGWIAVAGSHLWDEQSRSYNQVDAFFPFAITRIPYLEWDEGRISRPDDPSSASTSWAVREPGSEAHALFRRRVTLNPNQNVQVFSSHRALIEAIAHGHQQAGVSVGSLAALTGLSFEPWATESYDWIARTVDISTPWFTRWQDTLSSAPLAASYAKTSWLRRVP